MDKRPKIIREMFDQIAPTYDLLNRFLSLSIDTVWRRKAISRLGIKWGDSILDIATGTGDLSLLALRKNRDCHVVGIDVSGEMLRIAAKKRDRGGCSRQYFLVEGDACGMPFKGDAFDHAMVAFGIRNVPNVKGLFRETRRTLKKGGKFAILEFSIPEIHFIRKIYFLYFKKILPLIGGLFSGKAGAYRYLRDSVIAFHTPKELENMLGESGFVIVESLPLWFDICHLYIVKVKKFYF